ncbi:hypothetical protein C1I63_13850 [Rathayibacter caricis DSM 15933]|uniref:Uncharacterized protein n=1 Tax=Rathayibacter caricis DSM 15933 TaxID=1328867 RepID=A0A2T4UWC7_9MICO|nr:hypothetical protein [Rathayibacter caricis]PTL73813.1 hypothetical protein C1I63_13850 [Rathayibacter caricis DSM 15933]
MTEPSKGIEAGRRMFAERNGRSGFHADPSPTHEPYEKRPPGTVESGRALYEQKHPKPQTGERA